MDFDALKQSLESKIFDLIEKEGLVNVTNAKEELGLSRKFVICYLEYLDKMGNIVTIDNKRYLKK